MRASASPEASTAGTGLRACLSFQLADGSALQVVGGWVCLGLGPLWWREGQTVHQVIPEVQMPSTCSPYPL